MATPGYTTDLTDLSLADDVVNWDESSDATWDDAGAMVAETNFYIQNVECISAQFTKAGQGTIIYGHGSSVTIPTDGAVLIWHYWASPPSLGLLSAGGVKMLIGNAMNVFKAYDCSGSDFEPSPAGGWYNYAVDPSLTADDTVGSPATPYSHFGAAVNATAQARGNPHAVDAIRYGRCEARYNGGEALDYATFAGFAALDDAVANRWALLASIPGVPSGYRWQGLITLGYVSAVDFRDSNKNIFVANVLNVTANFNKIEIRQATSNVEWTSIAIAAAGTVSKGIFEMIDNATVVMYTCTFTDMATFVFLSNADINTTTFRRCGLITQNNAAFTGCTFDEPTGTAMLVDNPTNLSGCTFNSNGSGHAIEIDTPGTYSLDACLFNNFGTTGTVNAAIYNNSGGTVILNISNGLSPTYYNGTGASTTVNNAVSLTIDAPVSLVGAEVRIYDLDNSPAGSLGTELSGIESHTTATYVYSGTGGNLIWIQIMKSGYKEFGQQLTMPSVNGNFTALLQADLNA